jgi:predicted ribosome quality control (RQC) complex YloA/Tae2 family protein
MKTEISSLELHYLLREFEPLIEAKLEQVYQVGKEEFVLQFHVPNLGKRILRIIVGKLLYLASAKGDMPEKPPGFCLYLRKKLKNARLREVRQLGFERIVEFVFETKEAKFRMMIELFSKGNLILCDEAGVILSVLEAQEWKDRIVKSKEHYTYPKKEFNFLSMSKEELSAMLIKSDRENLVKTLAMDIGLGGIFAEELCFMAGVDKNLKSKGISGKEVGEIYDAIKNLLSKQLSPLIIYDDDSKTVVKDVVPFSLNAYKSLSISESSSFNSALDSVFTRRIDVKAIDTAEKAAKTKLDKIDEMIKQQEIRLEGLEKSEKDNQAKAERIYENYVLVKEILDEVNVLRKKMPWPEVKAKFKGHKIIVDINEKTGEIAIDI